jgi:ABC-2 type transport system ATP-binding protein
VTGLFSERIVAALTHNQVGFSELSVQRVSLEDAYLQLTRGQADYLAQPTSGTSEAAR